MNHCKQRKSFSVSFLGPKMRFVSIMVRNPIFAVLHFVFQNFHAQTAKWTFLGTFLKRRQDFTPKRRFEISPFLNEIFSAEKSYFRILHPLF